MEQNLKIFNFIINLELYTRHKNTFIQYELLKYEEIKIYYKKQFNGIKL